MPTYISLMKLTEQGAKDIKNAPARVEAAKKGLEAIGAKMTSFYVTMGEYDYVAIVEGPNDETALGFLMGLSSLGNVKTLTLKAFNEQEFAGIVKKMP